MNMTTDENLAPTLLAGQSLEIAVYENHAQDCRYKQLGETCETVAAKYGGGGNNVPIVVKSIGNGQTDNMAYSDIANTLDTMHDQQAVMITAVDCRNGTESEVNGTLQAKENGGTSLNLNNVVRVKEDDFNAAGTQSPILRLLCKTYGAQAVVEWGIAVVAALQQTEVLRQGLHEESNACEAQNRNKLDDCSLPCPSVVADWMLRDMREKSECGCSPQRQQSAEQRDQQSATVVPILSLESAQRCEEMFDMWQKGQGIGLLRQALSEIQEIWQSACCEKERCRYIVRRLTPLEAERLQGYPDGWTDIGEWADSKGKKRITSDSARYKALGNSIAIPPWLWVCDQIGQYLGEDKTMASLFDGIGGFPLIWSYLYGKENVLWASEIEEFPIAVTKVRFPDETKP